VEAQHLLNLAVDWNRMGGTSFSGESWMRNA
jgi:hypothetical protein